MTYFLTYIFTSVHTATQSKHIFPYYFPISLHIEAETTFFNYFPTNRWTVCCHWAFNAHTHTRASIKMELGQPSFKIEMYNKECNTFLCTHTCLLHIYLFFFFSTLFLRFKLVAETCKVHSLSKKYINLYKLYKNTCKTRKERAH